MKVVVMRVIGVTVDPDPIHVAVDVDLNHREAREDPIEDELEGQQALKVP